MFLRGLLLAICFAMTGSAADASDRGEYRVLERYAVPCSGHGGFGEKVLVRSGRQAGLEAAFRRWYAINGRDRSRCLFFFAFSSMTSYEVFNHPSRYSDAEQDAAPIGLSYYNNPNTGFEGWGVGGGAQHTGGPR
jgi:hypothetical protein